MYTLQAWDLQNSVCVALCLKENGCPHTNTCSCWAHLCTCWTPGALRALGGRTSTPSDQTYTMREFRKCLFPTSSWRDPAHNTHTRTRHKPEGLLGRPSSNKSCNTCVVVGTGGQVCHKSRLVKPWAKIYVFGLRLRVEGQRGSFVFKQTIEQFCNSAIRLARSGSPQEHALVCCGPRSACVNLSTTDSGDTL